MSTDGKGLKKNEEPTQSRRIDVTVRHTGTGCDVSRTRIQAVPSSDRASIGSCRVLDALDCLFHNHGSQASPRCANGPTITLSRLQFGTGRRCVCDHRGVQKGRVGRKDISMGSTCVQGSQPKGSLSLAGRPSAVFQRRRQVDSPVPDSVCRYSALERTMADSTIEGTSDQTCDLQTHQPDTHRQAVCGSSSGNQSRGMGALSSRNPTRRDDSVPGWPSRRVYSVPTPR